MRTAIAACFVLAACAQPDPPPAYEATTETTDCPPEIAARMPPEVTRCTVTIRATTAVQFVPDFEDGDGAASSRVSFASPPLQDDPADQDPGDSDEGEDAGSDDDGAETGGGEDSDRDSDDTGDSTDSDEGGATENDGGDAE